MDQQFNSSIQSNPPDDQLPKKKTRPIIVLIIVALLIIVGGGYYWWQKEIKKDCGPQPPMLCPEGSELICTDGKWQCKSVNQTAGWQTYQNDQYGFEIKYPAKYKTSQDTYGWSHSLVLFLSPSGQSYIIQVEAWDSADAFKNIYKTEPPFIVKTKDNKYITINHAGFEEKSIPEWGGMVESFKFIK